MKSLLNNSKVAITMLVAATAFAACSSKDDYAPYYTQYDANTASLKSAGAAVDLGLPSGTKWADRNVGAADAEDNGILFVWGDITGTESVPSSNEYSANPLTKGDLYEMFKGDEKVSYDYDTLNVAKITFGTELSATDQAYVDSVIKHKATEYASDARRFDANVITDEEGNKCLRIDLIDSTAVKYFECKQNNTYESVVGNDGVARQVFAGATITTPVDEIIGEAKYDAATANWGANWQMPTKAQLNELVQNCKWEFTEAGYTVTGPNGNSIFLPAAGYRYGEKLVGNGNAGYYVSGEILGSYEFPSLSEQKKNSTGSINSTEGMPGMLIFQHGNFDNSVTVSTNLTSNYAASIRPVAK